MVGDRRQHVCRGDSLIAHIMPNVTFRSIIAHTYASSSSRLVADEHLIIYSLSSCRGIVTEQETHMYSSYASHDQMSVRICLIPNDLLIW